MSKVRRCDFCVNDMAPTDPGATLTLPHYSLKARMNAAIQGRPAVRLDICKFCVLELLRARQATRPHIAAASL